MTWPSLAGQVELAADLFGARGAQLIGAWLERETARIDDAAFARLFADHLDLPGISPPDYNHRRVTSARGDLLGGIRFYNRDVERPFVEIVGHGFDDVDELRRCVRAEWAAFRPRYLRLQALPGTLSGPDMLLDNTIHAGRYRNLAECQGLVLQPFGAVDEAVAMMEATYAAVAAETPELARNVSPAASDELRHWHAADQLRAGRVDGVAVGLLAVAPGAVTWLEGDEVMEEVVGVGHRGHGYAAKLQAAWAHTVAADRDRLLIGTIDRLNVASRRTAERVGRPCLLEAVFVAL